MNKIVYLGTPKFAEIILQGLSNSPYKPIAVITELDKPVGRKQILTSPEVKILAQELQIPVFQPANRAELLETLKKMQPDLLVVAAYGRILRPEVLELPKYGCINVHGSILPKYRGASPVQAAILAGDKQTGVTIMKMDEGMDTGPILATDTCDIEPNETTPTLMSKLANIGSQLLINTLPDYLDGKINPQVQLKDKSSLTKLISKEDGLITGKQSPTEIERMLRAYKPWPGVWAEIDSQRVILLDAEIKNSVLIPKEVQLAGKNPVSWQLFCRDRAKLAQSFNKLLNPSND